MLWEVRLFFSSIRICLVAVLCTIVFLNNFSEDLFNETKCHAFWLQCILLSNLCARRLYSAFSFRKLSPVVFQLKYISLGERIFLIEGNMCPSDIGLKKKCGWGTKQNLKLLAKGSQNSLPYIVLYSICCSHLLVHLCTFFYLTP